MRKPIYYVGGSKGGVGKSIVAMALIDYLLTLNENVTLIETDNSNPDVAKAYSETVTAHLINLDDGNGWVNLVNKIDEIRDRVIVINSAARNNVAVSKFGKTLNAMMPELDRKLQTLWVINRQRDSIELLREFMEVMTNSTINVIRNGYFGEADKFELYNSSKTKIDIESSGVETLNFPDLADRVADDINKGRMTIAEASKTMPIGNRAELIRWRGEVAAMMEKLHERE